MKRFAILAAVVALIGCAQNDEGLDNITSTPEKSQTEFYASMPECDTRTYVEDNKYLRWNAGDEITVFAGNSYNSHWQFAGEDGANSGKFNEVEESGFVTGTPLDLTANYAIYPYDENITISESGIVSLTLPAVQEYNHTYANSFGAGANTMMAVTRNTSDNFLSFKNLCGYLKLKFYGENVTVKSVTVKGNNGEKIAGKATVSMAYGSEPTITMADDATDTIIIDCGEGVALSNDAANPTTFWVVIPEITFEGGITIEVTDINDQTFEKKTTNAVPIENNLIQPMAALAPTFTGETENPGIQEVPETWKIYYTATKNNIISPYAEEDPFGANILSNNWDSSTGEGIIICDGPITQIGSSTFYHMYSLTSVTIPDSVTSIGSSAFSSCTSLTSITIPDRVTSIGYYAFSSCPLTSVTIPDSVTEILDRTFYGCTSLTSVTIGNGVTEILDRTFYGCTSLTSVTIGNGVTKIGDSAFDGCSSLPIIDNIRYADTFLIEAIDKTLATYSIKEDTKFIKSVAFYGCTSLTSITIPDSVTEIGASAFRDCTSLTSVYITDIAAWCGISFDSYGNPLVYAHNLYINGELATNLVIPDSVTSIGGAAFSGCTSLTSVTIPDSVTEIGSSAFSSCTSLTSITIPDNVTSIGSSAFSGCTSLTSVTIPDSVTSIGSSAFSGCTSLTSVAIGNNVTSIGDYAFSGCPLSEIDIPDSVISIGDYALNLKIGGVVTIGRGVTSLGNDALCLGFSKLYIKAIAPPAGLSLTPFEELSPQMYIYYGIEQKIYVPQESYDEYLTVFDSIFNKDIGSSITTVFDGFLIPYNFE